MSGERAGEVSPIIKTTPNSVHHAVSSSGGSKIDIGAVMNSLPISGRTGAIVMKTVSIFLTSGRKASVNSKKRNRRVRKMPDERNDSKSYHAKVVESLRKKTKFSRYFLFFIYPNKFKV